jgi:hypothetical protein
MSERSLIILYILKELVNTRTDTDMLYCYLESPIIKIVDPGRIIHDTYEGTTDPVGVKI